MKIVIIDDDIDFCILFKRILKKSNHEVYVQHALKDGFRLIDEVHPEVIFLDNNLPDGEGWMWAKKIKMDLPNAFINLMSANDRSFLNLQEFDNAVWEKPITKEQIENYFRFLKSPVAA